MIVHSREPLSAQNTQTIALVGNPNSGKTSLFNRLTGQRRKVANYPGVTVDRHVGAVTRDPNTQLIDLPGCYSLVSRSLDEQLARDVLFGWIRNEQTPDGVIVVVDASNLERNLFLATQVIDLGLPTIVACNMIDVVRDRRDQLDTHKLAQQLGVPVIGTDARTGEGLDELHNAIRALDSPTTKAMGHPAKRTPFDKPAQSAFQEMSNVVTSRNLATPSMTDGIARILIAPDSVSDDGDTWNKLSPDDKHAIITARNAIETPVASLVCQRYDTIATIVSAVHIKNSDGRPTATDRIDRVLTHRFWGLTISSTIMGAMFLAVFSGAAPLMDGVEFVVSQLATAARSLLGTGVFADLVVNGVIAGVGNVVVFVPQIAILFFIIAFLEDSGYMARVAFVMDRIMSATGLHGRSFIPLLSSFACAVPAIMAARTIDSRRDRLTTIMVAPLMSCSARLPVYIVIISAVFAGNVWLEAGILFTMYALGLVTALMIAAVLKRTILKGPPATFILELPPYRRPRFTIVCRETWDRTKPFLTQAGTVILAFSVILWALAYYPRANNTSPDNIDTTAQLRQSYIGRLGQTIEPVIKPLGFDWKIGVGLASSFAAREVFVATMGVVHGVGEDADETSVPLREKLLNDKWPDGRRVLTPLVGVSLMVFYVFACQCMSTLAIVKRETNGWRWPTFMFCYMTTLAYVASFVVYQGGQALGLG